MTKIYLYSKRTKLVGSAELRVYQSEIKNPKSEIQMFRYTPTTLQKLEQLFREGDYIVRYEKGNFKAGYCLLLDKKVVVINKYFDTESRINSLLDILSQ